MEGIRELAAKYYPYFFLAVAIVWFAIIGTGGSWLLLWPALTSGASGIFLVLRPTIRFSPVLARSSALYGLLLAGYQAYVAVTLIGSALSTFASYSLASFALMALAYLLLLYESMKTGTKLP